MHPYCEYHLAASETIRNRYYQADDFKMACIIGITVRSEPVFWLLAWIVVTISWSTIICDWCLCNMLSLVLYWVLLKFWTRSRRWPLSLSNTNLMINLQASRVGSDEFYSVHRPVWKEWSTSNSLLLLLSWTPCTEPRRSTPREPWRQPSYLRVRCYGKRAHLCLCGIQSVLEQNSLTFTQLFRPFPSLRCTSVAIMAQVWLAPEPYSPTVNRACQGCNR